MLITIEICDDGEGRADVTVAFDPDISPETCHTPATRVLGRMMAAVSSNMSDVKVDAGGKDENQFEMFSEAPDIR